MLNIMFCSCSILPNNIFTHWLFSKYIYLFQQLFFGLDGGSIALAKVIVIGTSNSVMGKKGFIKSLSIEHDVINLSSGRVPFYCHLKTIELNKDLIESSDVLIIDHYINDLNFYFARLGESYSKECEYFYRLLSTINTNIINLLFPIENLFQQPSLNYYERVKQLTKQYKLSLIDLNDYQFKPHHYHNSLHLNHKTSYLLGLSLSKVINVFQNNKPYGGKLISNPFKIIDARSLVKFTPESEFKTFKNSLLEVNYVDVKNKFSIHNVSGMTLKSIGYLTPKQIESKSGVIINNKYSFSLPSGGYFHEAFDQEIIINDKLTLAPVQGSHSKIAAMMQRSKISGNFDFLYVTEIMLFNGAEVNYQAAKRTSQSIFLKDLEPMIDSMFVDFDNQSNRLPSVIVGALRDAAVLLEDTNLKKSYELMELAHEQRPTWSLIKNKLAEYNDILNA